MLKRSTTDLPLHYGKAPPWLFSRMKRFSAALMELIIFEFGVRELLKRLSDPIWFQALGCASGFDWHSSGLTTTLCGALKEGLSIIGEDVPLAICGGKAKRALDTPKEIMQYGDRWGIDVSNLIEFSKLCAKIDNSAIQDGYNLYHHTFIFTKEGEWAIIQQGMNEQLNCARRYQWLSRSDLNLTLEPHTGITCDRTDKVLNLVAKESVDAQEAILDFTKNKPDRMMKVWNEMSISFPKRHSIEDKDFDKNRLSKIFTEIYETEPQTFTDLIKIKGVGKRTLRALSLVAELIYKKPPSFKDPARFSFAHGGKDGHPYPVDKKTYDTTIETLKECIDKAKLGDREKLDALRRLSNLS